MEIAANCSPAIQPSVRVESRAMSSAESLRPIPWLRNPAASEGVKRKSTARSSVNCPRARRRARGSCGSSRVAMTRCICGGQMLDEIDEGMVNRLGIKYVVVVKDEDELVLYCGQVIEQGRQHQCGWRWLR